MFDSVASATSEKQLVHAERCSLLLVLFCTGYAVVVVLEPPLLLVARMHSDAASCARSPSLLQSVYLLVLLSPVVGLFGAQLNHASSSSSSSLPLLVLPSRQKVRQQLRAWDAEEGASGNGKRAKEGKGRFDMRKVRYHSGACSNTILQVVLYARSPKASKWFGWPERC